MAKETALADRLASVDLFAGVSKRGRQAIASSMRMVQHTKGQEVTATGRQGIGFHLILDGTADVLLRGKKVNSLGPGDYFGEISVVDGKPRSAVIRATSDLSTAAISSWKFRPMLREQPAIAEALLDGLCARLRAAEARRD